eukprot:8254994-Pyramimonas_sp.AAC.1
MSSQLSALSSHLSHAAGRRPQWGRGRSEGVSSHTPQALQGRGEDRRYEFSHAAGSHAEGGGGRIEGMNSHTSHAAGSQGQGA